MSNIGKRILIGLIHSSLAAVIALVPTYFVLRLWLAKIEYSPAALLTLFFIFVVIIAAFFNGFKLNIQVTSTATDKEISNLYIQALRALTPVFLALIIGLVIWVWFIK